MELYVSSGAFTGRINGRNPRLLADYWDQFDCDGFELMLFDDLEPQMDSIIELYQKARVPIRVLHADKRTGDWMGNPDPGAQQKLLDLFERNCRVGNALGAQKIVTHIWGRPYSDQHLDQIAQQVGLLLQIARRYNLDLVAENCVCFSSPIENLEKLCQIHPTLGVTIDTRPAQFHRELARTVQSPVFQRNMRHVHINDYKGGYMQWDALYPIYQPGQGEIDFDLFFDGILQKHPQCSITLEAPAMRPDCVDVQTLGRALTFIRQHLKEPIHKAVV